MSNKPCAIRLVVTLNVPKHQHLTGNEKQQILVENMGSYIQLEGETSQESQIMCFLKQISVS